MPQSPQDINRTDDQTAPEERPAAGVQTGKQAAWFGANWPGGAGLGELPGMGVVNPLGLGYLATSPYGLGNWGATGSAGPALVGAPGGAALATPEQFSGSVYGFASVLPGYGSAAPGTYLTYRAMRANPTVAIARMAATAPIRAADITVQASGGDAPDEMVEFIESILLPLWPRFIRDAMFALDYGWQGWEKVYQPEDGYIVLKKLKPLAPDITTIRWDEATGSFAGLTQRDVTLDPAKCFVWTYDQEFDAYYGRSRHENIRAAWWAWMELLRKEGQYISKVSGVTPIVTYPEGVGKDRAGAERPNFELAQQVLWNLGRGNGVAMPNRLAQWAQDLVRAGIDVSQLAAWQIKFLEPAGDHGAGFVAQMQHKETLMLRGWLVPERAVAEGHFGTKAEAEAHQDMAVAIAQHDLFDLLRCVNEAIVDPLLALNFGPQARGLVSVTASPLIDDKAVLARDIVRQALSSPAGLPLLLKVLDFDAMLEQQGLPVSGATAAEAMQGNAGGAAGQGQEGGGDPQGAGHGAPAPAAAAQADGRMMEMTRRLLRSRELSRWIRKRGGARARTHTTGATADRIDLAGFDPSQQRDERGQWTGGGAASFQAVADSVQQAKGGGLPDPEGPEAKRGPASQPATQPTAATDNSAELLKNKAAQVRRLLEKRSEILRQLAQIRPSTLFPGNEDKIRELRQTLDGVEAQINQIDPTLLSQRPTFPGGGELDTDLVRAKELQAIQDRRDALLQEWSQNPLSWHSIQQEIDELNARQRLLQDSGHIGIKPDGTPFAHDNAGQATLDAFQKREQRQQEISQMSKLDRVGELLDRLSKSGKLDKAMQDRIDELRRPENWAVFATVLTATALVPGAAEVAGLVGAVLLASDGGDAGGLLAAGIAEALMARTDEDFDRGADALAQGLSRGAMIAAQAAAGAVVGKVANKTIKSVGQLLEERKAAAAAKAAEAKPGGPAPGSEILPVGDEPGNNLAPEVPPHEPSAESGAKATKPAQMPRDANPPANTPAVRPATKTAPSGKPDPAAKPKGTKEVLDRSDKEPTNIRALEVQDESAHVLARAGYDIKRLSKVKGQKSPDFEIEGSKFDNVAPTTDRARNIWSRILEEKIQVQQADRVVINLKDSQVSVDELRAQFQNHPMPGLKEAIVITRNGEIVHIWPQ